MVLKNKYHERKQTIVVRERGMKEEWLLKSVWKIDGALIS